MEKVKDNEHLRELLKSEIAEHGTSADLNHLDVRNVTNMSNLFQYSDFQGDVSKWKMENVEKREVCFLGARTSIVI